MKLESVQPINGFVLLRKADAVQKSSGGLYLPESVDRNNTGEAAGIVVALSSSPQILVDKAGNETLIYPQQCLSVGDRVLHRGFLRHVNAIGEMLGCSSHDEYYLIKVSDILAALDGDSVTVGKYGEYRA
jgi:co-chaperonin GroES (HSP10)